MKRVVILVDNKKRDLPGCSLIAHHLKKRFGIRCELQPLESWRSCLAAFKPHYILFNHLTASHLAKYSNRLKKMNIKVGVLPNEGIIYDKEALAFNAGKYHSYAHIDNFFCWNKEHANAVLDHMKDMKEKVYVVGVPRFDFYFEPWRNVFKTHKDSSRPTILVCTNFVFATYGEFSRERIDKIFSPWKDRYSLYRNYMKLIEMNTNDRLMFLKYIKELLERTEYGIKLRPHPRESTEFYKKWISKLPEAQKRRIHLSVDENITEALLSSDLHIACGTCTTTLEAWILRRPSISVVLNKHPVFYREEQLQANKLCYCPEELPMLVEEALKRPDQPEFAEKRKEHLKQWCNLPTGDSSYKVAKIIYNTINNTAEPCWRLDLMDYKRALKLRIKNRLGLAYGNNLWRLLYIKITGVADPIESKFIRPRDVREWADRLERISNYGFESSTSTK